MTQTPLERAAEQLLKANDLEGYAYWIMGGRKKMAQRHYDQARAVLIAIREPSDAMLEAGKAAMGGGPNDPTEGDAWNCHEAMIDAALGEETI